MQVPDSSEKQIRIQKASLLYVWFKFFILCFSPLNNSFPLQKWVRSHKDGKWKLENYLNVVTCPRNTYLLEVQEISQI